MSDTSSKLKINIQQQGVVDLKSGISIGDTFEYQDSIYLAHKILTDGTNQEMSYLKLFDSNNNNDEKNNVYLSTDFSDLYVDEDDKCYVKPISCTLSIDKNIDNIGVNAAKAKESIEANIGKFGATNGTTEETIIAQCQNLLDESVLRAIDMTIHEFKKVNADEDKDGSITCILHLAQKSNKVTETINLSFVIPKKVSEEYEVFKKAVDIVNNTVSILAASNSKSSTPGKLALLLLTQLFSHANELKGESGFSYLINGASEEDLAVDLGTWQNKVYQSNHSLDGLSVICDPNKFHFTPYVAGDATTPSSYGVLDCTIDVVMVYYVDSTGYKTRSNSIKITKAVYVL